MNVVFVYTRAPKLTALQISDVQSTIFYVVVSMFEVYHISLTMWRPRCFHSFSNTTRFNMIVHKDIHLTMRMSDTQFPYNIKVPAKYTKNSTFEG